MLNQRLQELIQTLGIKKGEFSERIGFSQAYISMLLSGKRQMPTDRFYDSVAREFQVNPDWLRSGEGEMFLLPDFDLSEADSNLLKKYRALPLSERKVIDEIVDAMLLKRFASAEHSDSSDQ